MVDMVDDDQDDQADEQDDDTDVEPAWMQPRRLIYKGKSRTSLAGYTWRHPPPWWREPVSDGLAADLGEED